MPPNFRLLPRNILAQMEINVKCVVRNLTQSVLLKNKLDCGWAVVANLQYRTILFEF
jgi:hypothetical protein